MSADNHPQKSAGRSGMSTLDLLGGSVAVNRVVKLMLHKSTMTYQELCDAVDQLPPEKRMSRDELDGALDELVGKDWITKSEEGGKPVYKVALGAKPSSAEQLHSDSAKLPHLDVAVDKDVNPGIKTPEVKQDEGSPKKGGLMDNLRSLFGGKK